MTTQFGTKIRTDLDKGLRQYTFPGKMFTQDNKANRIDVEVYDHNLPVPIEGTIVGIVKRNDGNAIAFVGGIDNGKPYVELPEAAYAVEGPISILIRNVVDDQKTVIGICDAYVTKSADADYVTAGTEIVSIEELSDKLDQIEPLLERLQVIDLDEVLAIQQLLTSVSEREMSLAEKLEAFESLISVDEENETMHIDV